MCKRSKYHYIFIAIFIIVSIAIWLFQMRDPYNLCLLFGIVILFIVPPVAFRYWSKLDIVLGVITLSDIISCCYASCIIPAVSYAQISIFCFAIYLILRRLLVNKHFTYIILIGSYIPIGIALLLAVFSFTIFVKSTIDAGFENIYYLRMLFHPLGYTVNQWTEILLVLCGWICLIKYKSEGFILITLCLIIVSFSRGGYIALGGYLIMWMLFLTPSIKKYRLFIICLVSISIMTFLFPKEVMTTFSLNATESQHRSTQSRINTTFIVWNTYKDDDIFHILLGHGNGNFSFILDKSLNQDSTTSSTIIPPNLFTQILIEKGAIGILLFFLLTVSVILEIIKDSQVDKKNIIGITLLALCIKEMTQANLFNTPFLLLMLYVLLSYLQQGANRCENIVSLKKMYLVPSVMLCLYFCWWVFININNENKEYCRQSFQAFKKGDMLNSIELIERTTNNIPCLVHKGILYNNCFIKTGIMSYAQKAKEVYDEVKQLQPNDIQIDYLQGKLYFDIGYLDESCSIFRKLSALYSKNSLYLFSLSKVLYQKGDKTKSLPLLIKAIYYTPRILNSEYILEIKKVDQHYYQLLHNQLSLLHVDNNTSIIDLAHLGYITYWCGHKLRAKKYLEKAVKDLPNLSTPWYLLGDKHKYNVLKFVFFKERPDPKSIFDSISTDKLLFESMYKRKFQIWYGYELNELP